MDLSIIVVAWNVRDLVYDCLKSVYAETHGVDFEVIFVDNGGSDGSAEMVRREFPQAKILVNVQNQGFIRANNQAIEIAQGRYVLLLNSDTIILNNAIAKTVAFADQHREAAVVACRVLNPDRTLQGNCFRFYSTLNMFFDATFLSRAFPKHRLFGRKFYAGWNYDTVREVDVVVGCFSLVRMEAISKVGMMDEVFFVYGDDIDWCYRFVKAGWKILYAPVGEIIHLGGQTTSKAAGKHALQLYGSYLINVKKHYSYSTFLVCRLLTALYLSLRVPYWFLRAALRSEDRTRAYLSAKTFCRGVYYCLFDWKGMLMNRHAVESIL